MRKISNLFAKVRFDTDLCLDIVPKVWYNRFVPKLLEVFIMSKRWTMAEDLIIYKYCVENRWAFSSDIEIEWMKALLIDAGFTSRSDIAIKKRAREYDSLIGGWYSSYTTNQIRSRYQIFASEHYKKHYRELQSFIKQKNNCEKKQDDLSLLVESSDNLYHMVHVAKGRKFLDVLEDYIQCSGIKPRSKMYRDVNMSEDSFSAIRRGKYKTISRENIFKICFGLRLHYDDAVILMKSCGCALQEGEVLDSVVEYFLRQGPRKKIWYKYKGKELSCYIYDTDLIDADLCESKVPPLFWGARRGDDKDDLD